MSVNNKGKKATPKKKSKKEYIYAGIALVIAAAMLISLVLLVIPGKSDEDKQLDALLNGKQKINVLIETDKGEMIAELRPDLMPITVRNFVKLTNRKFYDGLTFHRVEDWVIQGGDPKGDGTGGPGWTIKLETNSELKNVKYCIAMARTTQPNTAGSQFYILKKDTAQLDGDYAVFGNIIEGQDVVDKIKIGDKIKSIRIVE